MRRPRRNSAPPRASSRFWMRELTAGCPMPSEIAARLKLPARATRSNAASWAMSIQVLPSKSSMRTIDAIRLKHRARTATVACMIRMARTTDAEAMAEIYRPIVADTAISFEMDPPDAAEMDRRRSAVAAFAPWLVFDQGGVLGYAYASKHRERAAYQWCVDVSVYVANDHRQRGVGRALYTSLFALLRLQGFYAAHAGITLPNHASVGLHEALGFGRVATYPAVGFKL